MEHKLRLDRRETGRRIKQLIAASGLTREEIAAFLGLRSTRVIYDWEFGGKLPGLENLANLAALLQVRMEDILAL